MTQKELLYIEDAIGHEKNIMSICEDIVNNLEDEDLISFMKSEIKSHQKMEKKLKDMLEKKSNE